MLKIINKYKIHIASFILLMFAIYVSMNYKKLTEGLSNTYTSCSVVPDNCQTCVNAQITNTTSPCYWDTVNKNCTAFDGSANVRTCPTCTYTDCSSCVGNGCYWDASTNKCGSDLSGNYKARCPCTSFTDCSSCTKNGCYWDSSSNKCGSDLTGNYKATCPCSFTDCSSCTTHDNCYWNSTSKTCKLNSGAGYSRVCSSNGNTCPNFIKLPFDTYMQGSTS